jgi:flagellar biosynthetic protein FlhB
MESAERIHPATPHRRQLARQQGRVAKSHDLPLAGVFLAGVLLLLLGGGELFGALADYLRQQLGDASHLVSGADSLRDTGGATILRLGRSLALVCGGLLAVAVLGHLLQTGFRPRPQQLAPDLSRLDPLASATRMFSGDTAAKQLMLLVKLALIGGTAAWAVWSHRNQLLGLGNLAPAAMLDALSQLFSGVCLKVGAALLLAAAADYGFQRWRYEQSLQMTAEELREELRNQNGDPAVQQRRRKLQRELVLSQLEAAVSRAQLILVQGSSLAVALQYEGRQALPAPLVAAKGRGDAAARIRDTAKRLKIRLVDEPQLARSIAQHTPVGAPLAAEHYRAVASLWQSS